MLTEKPHLAGTAENDDLATEIKAFWESVGFDHVTLAPYEVLLSYPNMSNLNFVEILDANDSTVYKSNLTEPILTPEEDKPNVVPPFNAYSPPGDVQVHTIYIHILRISKLYCKPHLLYRKGDIPFMLSWPVFLILVFRQ